MKTGYVVGTVVVGLALVASLIAAERSTHAYATPYMLQFTSNGEVCAQLKLLKNSTLDIGATNANAKGEITVNSSLGAVAVYQAFGFVPTGSTQQVHGISFLPMRRSLSLA